MSAPGDVDEFERLSAIAAEYSVTIRVLAVVVELLLREIGGDALEIADEMLAQSPNIKAWRIPELAAVAITVDRSE